ncbi:uncharacterized protein LOC104887023 isoform X1 [Beta vulgaris subsp. vulgaris]|uniref:uncharacterized protein LOC104887023 isoform X1 n=1 Tax=Beta vulgaris subsp. vulgaris TaxID=3555 RepID=UPI002036AA58|nr:uncharacterized protein LOC104887023 isoform X1 [Beta vulgaris subsp. vulgaris]XP_048494882.1 uncharacterized protein LOC104887023 isoform X1 [Beta vulgaris subsp. vulgaris]XP_048494884.1 uncharacterized protein LOC104887023 isoform X1 [Beta vulgaris subsp. vulgaris]
MADSLHVGDNKKELKRTMICSTSQTKNHIVASIPKYCSMKSLRRIVNVEQGILGMGTISEVGLFLLKTAILEAVRRFSKAHCPFLWQSLQALQFVCLPPFKWIQKWGLFRGLVKGMQALSRPLLLLSVASSVSNRSANVEDNSGSVDASQPRTDLQSDSLANRPSDSSSCSGENESQSPERWMLQLFAELEKEEIILPERITEDDLRRFYHVANGDFSSFLSSVKRTINWRQNFRFMSIQELEDWSEMVFWHGIDAKQHPCLIIRVQSACSNIMSTERSRLPEVVVSQIEYGILHLVRAEDPLVTVLMDCEGLSPFGFPIHMMRSCAILLQDHYPNRLAALFVLRLPPIARVIAQTLFQVLRPGTRRKLRILGEDYQKVLSEHLQVLPSLLGGDCSCPKCAKFMGKDNNVVGPSLQTEVENLPSLHSAYHAHEFKYIKCDRIWKSTVIALLLLLVCVVFPARFQSLKDIQLYRSGW